MHTPSSLRSETMTSTNQHERNTPVNDFPRRWTINVVWRGCAYMQVLQSVPQLAEELEGDLTFSLKAYGEHLATIGQPSSALWLYSQVPVLCIRSFTPSEQEQGYPAYMTYPPLTEYLHQRQQCLRAQQAFTMPGMFGGVGDAGLGDVHIRRQAVAVVSAAVLGRHSSVVCPSSSSFVPFLPTAFAAGLKLRLFRCSSVREDFSRTSVRCSTRSEKLPHLSRASKR